MSNVHELKIWSEFFDAVKDGRKTFEVRYNDREYQEGDYLVLREIQKSQEEGNAPDFTGRAILAKIKFVFRDKKGENGTHFLQDGYVVLGIEYEGSFV